MSITRTPVANRWLLALVCVLALALPALAPESAAAGKPSLAEINQGPFGYWKHVDEDTGKIQSIFKLWKSKDKLVGRIEKVFPKGEQPAQKICSECEGKLKDRPIPGLIFFWGFVPDEDDARKWVDGKILNPEDGNIYHAEAELSEDGKTLKVFGYLKVLVKIGGTSEWKRPTKSELEGIL